MGIAYTVRLELLQALLAGRDHRRGRTVGPEPPRKLGVDPEARRGVGLAQELLGIAIDQRRVNGVDAKPSNNVQEVLHLLRSVEAVRAEHRAAAIHQLGFSVGHCE